MFIHKQERAKENTIGAGEIFCGGYSEKNAKP